MYELFEHFDYEMKNNKFTLKLFLVFSAFTFFFMDPTGCFQSGPSPSPPPQIHRDARTGVEEGGDSQSSVEAPPIGADELVADA